MQDGTPARFAHGRGFTTSCDATALEVHLGDDLILASVLKLHEEGSNVVVVTDDAAVRLRARGLGLTVCPMPEKYRRAGADPLQAENAKLRREVDELRTAMPRLDVHFAEGGTILKMVRKQPPSGTRNRFHDALRLQPLSLDRLPVIYEIELQKPTKPELDSYNKKLEEFRPTYDKYAAAERDAFELFPHRSCALELVVRNSGGRPAESVKLTLELPEGVTVVHNDDVPREPVMPVGPKLPGRKRGIYASPIRWRLCGVLDHRS